MGELNQLKAVLNTLQCIEREREKERERERERERDMERKKKIHRWFSIHTRFVELGGGVGDVLVWCREEAYVEFGFR